MNVSSRSSPAKKRKVDDGRADTPDVAQDVNSGGGFLSSWFGYYFSGRGGDESSATPRGLNNSSQLDRIEQIVMRMEEKLATVSGLESRCDELEAKCSSLESMLQSASQSVKDNFDRLEDKVDSLHSTALNLHAYNEMLVRNQSWEYSAAVSPVIEWLNCGYERSEAVSLVNAAKNIKEKTIKMRRGEFPDIKVVNGVERKGISLHPLEIYDENSDPEFRPHWKEFAAALKQFTPAMNLLPENSETFFSFYGVQLDNEAMMMIKDALMGMPFTETRVRRNHEHGGMSMDDILDIAESNTHLRRLGIMDNQILSDHVERLCSIAHNYPLVQLQISNSIDDPGIGNAMLTSILTSGELKLESLSMSDCHINSDACMVLADFLATNSRLKTLDLSGNEFNDGDASLIANALRTNTTLRYLLLFDYNQNITNTGVAAFDSVLYDKSSLNAVADSNHCVELNELLDDLNLSDVIEVNRGRKIYSLLSERHKTMSNVQYFGDIDVKMLPSMLEAVQRYAKFWKEVVRGDSDPRVESLSIVYEIMRWEKVLNLFES